MPDERVILFIDGQNMYMSARRAFFGPNDPGRAGQFDPLAMGKRICARAPAAQPRRLMDVRVYTGRPNPNKQRRMYAAHMKQCAAWKAAGVSVIARPLRYPPGFPVQKPEEKGIDVQLALDFVALAMDGLYDVGILASTDTDLKPALEMVIARFNPIRRVEVAAWRSPTQNAWLSLPGGNCSCHFWQRVDYDAVEDPRDYNL